MQTTLFSVPTWLVLTAAGSIGIAGDALLRGGNMRAGLAIWLTALVASVLALGDRLSTERKLMLVGMALGGFGLVWRDSEMLYKIDILSVLCMGALTLWHGTGRTLGELTLVETIRAGVIAAMNTFGGGAGVISDGLEDGEAMSVRRARVRGLVIGAVIAVPPIVIVSALLRSSDAVFDGMLARFFASIVSDGFSHLLVIGLLSWVAAGWIRAALGRSIGGGLPAPTSPGVAFITVSVGLYALLALLTLFVATQAQVLFGGEAFLRETAGLTVATYARQGFFELVVAAVVVLATLVVAEWLMAADDLPGRRHYRWLSIALLVLVAALLVSSAARIWLYLNEFGLSVDRAFASAGIVWVFGVLAAFASTTLRGQSSRFMSMAVMVTAAWVAMMNLSNPEALVVEVNVARAAQGQTFDAKYHATLSADALPTLLTRASRLSGADCMMLQQELRTWWATRLLDETDGGRDWRGRNLPLVRARSWYASGTPVCPASATAVAPAAR